MIKYKPSGTLKVLGGFFMSDENKPLNEKDKKRLAEGRGQGTGIDYIPFIKVGEFSSDGESIRVKGHVAKRIHHFLSGIELSLFVIFDWHINTLDIREQFPIPLKDSLYIAKKLGIKHPQHHGELTIVTTDIVVDFKGGKKLAFAVKPFEKLKGKRLAEKLLIEKVYWESKKVDWLVFTENEIEESVKENMNWLRPMMDIDQKCPHEIYTADLISFYNRILKYPKLKLTKICATLDDDYELEPGYHIAVLRYGIANRFFRIPLKTHYYSLTCAQLALSNEDERGILNVS